MKEIKINFQYKDLIKICDYLPVAILISDLNGKILKINKEFIKIFHYKLNEIPTISDWFNKTCPDLIYRKQTIKKWNNDIQTVIKNKKELKPETYNITNKNNKILSVKINFKIIDNFVLVIFNDITGKKVTEKMLHEREIELRNERDMLQLLINGLSQIGIGIDIINKNYQILYQNSLLQKKFGNLKGRPCYSIYIGRKKPCEVCPAMITINKKKINSNEVQDRDGRYYRIFSAPLPNDKGIIDRALEVITEITDQKKAEQAVKNSNIFLDNIIKQSPNSIGITDKNGTLIKINKACCILLNISPNEVIGKYNVLKDNIVKEQGFLPLVKQVFEKGKTVRFELKYDSSTLKSIKLRKIKFVILDVTIFPIKNEKGEITNSVIQHIDITERKLAEQALLEREERYKELANSISDVFFAMDNKLKYTFWNKASEILTGISSKDAIGKSIYELFPEIKGTKAELLYKKAIKEKKAVNFINIHNLKGKNYVFEINAYPTKNGISVFIKDITERKKAEEALRESEYFLKKSQKVTHLGSYIFDIKKGTRISSETLDEIFGIDNSYPKDINGWIDIIHPDQKEEMLKYLTIYVIKEHNFFNKEYRIIRFNDKAERWVLGLGELEFDEKGNPIKMIGTIQDITEKKQAEEQIKRLNKDLAERIFERTAQLEAVNKELESFTYSVSHDLRAPLRHIHGFLNILEENIGHTLDKENQRIFSIILKSAEHMGKLVDSLLSFSRMNKNELCYEEIDMNELVTNIIKDFKPEIQNRNIKWEIHKLPKVKGDRTLLRQVWENLISNAIKYTNKCKNTIIEINYMQGSSNEIVFFVRDNGIGFDMNYINKLFGVFQRLHNSEEYKGIGIGLANVKKIINKHGGNVWAQGKLNKGATFYFSLPANNKDINKSK